MPRITTSSGGDYCGKCIRCELLQEEGRAERVERERDELREIVRELADQEIHENDLDASYVRTSLIVKARRVLEYK